LNYTGSSGGHTQKKIGEGRRKENVARWIRKRRHSDKGQNKQMWGLSCSKKGKKIRGGGSVRLIERNRGRKLQRIHRKKRETAGILGG